MIQETNINEMNLDKESFKNTLFRIGAISAIVSLVMIPIQIVLYLLWPHPTSIIEWFELINCFEKGPHILVCRQEF